MIGTLPNGVWGSTLSPVHGDMGAGTRLGHPEDSGSSGATYGGGRDISPAVRSALCCWCYVELDFYDF